MLSLNLILPHPSELGVLKMTVAEKSTLCIAALLWGECVAYIGLSFSAMAEPEEFDVSRQLFWIFLGIACGTVLTTCVCIP